MQKTRAIRFSGKEEELIQEFLIKNPFFDFSTLARTSILSFIENPHLKITPVKSAAKVTGQRIQKEVNQ